LPGRNTNAYSDPHAFTYRNSDSDGNSYTDSDRNGYGYGYGDNHTTSISYAYGNRDSDNYTKANANAKAAANAVPSSDAVSEWVKKLKELPALGGVIGNSRGNSRVPCFVVDRLLRRRW
jgi:hypothetical protein